VSFTGNIADLVQASDNALHAIAPWWHRVKLGQVARVINGYPFESSQFTDEDGVPLIRIRDVTSGSSNTFYRGAIPEGYWVEPGDMIVGMDGDFNLRIWEGARGLLNQRVCKIVPNPRVYNAAFLSIVLPGYLKLINENTPSITVKHLSSRTLQEVPLPFPPLTEQCRIMARVETMLARTHRARAELGRVAALAKQLWEATIKRAYEPDASNGWSTATAVELAEIKSGTALGKRHPYGTRLVERPYLRVANVQRGHLNLKEVKSVQVSEAEAERLALRPGDVLMNEGGDRDKLGRGWIWGGEVPGCIHQNHVFRLRLKTDAITPIFLSRYANYFGQRYFLDEGKQTTNLASISMAKVAALPVPVPPPGRAAEIDRHLDAAERRANALAYEAARALALLDHLDATILARAVHGDLVPQDLADESAVALLARLDIAQPPASPKRRQAA